MQLLSEQFFILQIFAKLIFARSFRFKKNFLNYKINEIVDEEFATL